MAQHAAPRRPPAPQRRAQPVPRPAAGRARQPVPEPHRPQRARQRAAAAVGAGVRTARPAGAGHRRRPGLARVAGAARQRLVVEHPLQAFALPAFDVDGDPRLRSFNRELRRGAARQPAALPAARRADQRARPRRGRRTRRRRGRRRAQPQPFFAAPLPPPGPEWREVALPQLQRVLPQPLPRSCCAAAWASSWRAQAEELQDDEPLRCADCPRRQRAGAAAAAAAAGRRRPGARCRRWRVPAPSCPTARSATPSCSTSCRRCRTSPAGCATRWPSRCCRRTRWRSTSTCRASLAAAGGLCRPARLRPAALALRRARAPATTSTPGCSTWCCAPPRRPAWRCARAGCVPTASSRFAPCADAAARLAELLALYRRGLSEPLHFYPRAAWALARHDGPGAARRSWRAERARRFAEECRPGLPAGAARRGRAAGLPSSKRWPRRCSARCASTWRSA